MRNLIAVCALLAAGLAAAAGEVRWNDPGYPAEFRYFTEAGSFDAESWGELGAEARAEALEGAAAPAAQRAEQVKAYYSGMSARWALAGVQAGLSRLNDGGIRAVRIWFGEDCAAYLEAKRSALSGLLAPGAQVTAEAAAAAAPYLDAAGGSELKAAVKAGGAAPEKLASQQKRQAEMAGRVSGLGGAYSDSLKGGSGGKFFDKSAFSGGAPVLGEAAGLPRGNGLDQRELSGNYRSSYAKTVSGGSVPGVDGSPQQPKPPAAFGSEDLQRIDKVVAEMKANRQAAGSENGWLGNFKQSVGLAKADSGCSGWSAATMSAIKSDPALAEKYEVGYVRGLRNPLGAVTKWPPSVPLPLPHFVAVVWPKGTDPNETAIYVDAWAGTTKRGPIGEYTREYSFDPKDLTPTVYYDREVKKEIRLPNGKTRVVTEIVETPIPLVKANPWIFFK